ncbi:MAG: hypothetical protein VX113_09490, partial [Pseudomonadota bacterium]|nr:hypothetical protein [Pseudomonadota bacterium]
MWLSPDFKPSAHFRAHGYEMHEGFLDEAAIAARLSQEAKDAHEQALQEGWRDEGHPWLGARLARGFDGKKRAFLGTIVRWLPAGETEEDFMLFHVRHDDGDTEDL